MTQPVRRLILILLSLGCWSQSGCAQKGASTAASPLDATLRGADQSLPASRRLELLAERERGARSRPRSSAASPAPRPSGAPAEQPVALPPGVEPEALALRDRSDPKAFLTVQQALTHVSQQAAPDERARRPAAGAAVKPPTEDDKLAALKLYAKARTAAIDNRHLQAITDLQRALELDPTSPQVMRELARNYLAVGNTLRAVDLYEQLAAVQPEHSEALFTLGLSAANRRDFAKAVMILGKLRGGGKSFEHDAAANALADYTLSVALRELGYDRASIETARRAVELPEQLPETEHGPRLESLYAQRGDLWRAIGDAHCRLGEFEQALQAYARSADLPLADPAALHPRRVYANLSIGRRFAAQLCMYQAISGSPPSAPALPDTSDSRPASPASRPAVSDRDVRLCAYLAQYAAPVDVLAEAAADLYRAHPDDASYVRSAAALASDEQARRLLKEFVSRRPRDLDGVRQMLTWLAQSSPAASVDLAIALAQDHPDLADAYTDRLAIAVPSPSVAIAAAAGAASAAQARLHARLLGKVGALGEAWAACATGRARWPEDRWLLLQQLQLAAAMHEPALFEHTLDAATGLNDVPALLAISQSRRALGQTELAVHTAQVAVDREPRNAEALIELARAHLGYALELSGDASKRSRARAELDKALRHAEEAAAIDPMRDEPYELMALAYGQGGPLADANLFRQTVQRLRTADPESPLLARLAAQEAIGQRRYQQALDRLLNTYDSDPADLASLSMAVTAWERWGRLDAAEQWLNDRLAQRPGDPALLEQWVRVQVLQQRPEAAVQRLEEILASNPDDLAAQRMIESVFRTTGRMQAALPYGQRRLLARPEGARREVELAALYAGADQPEKAVERLQWIRDHCAQAGLDDLTAAVGIAMRLRGDEAGRDALTLELVELTIARFSDAPLQVYGSGLRALARTEELGERFDALVERAAASARGASDGSEQAAGVWQELAQALVDAGLPHAAARALHVRLRSSPALEPAAMRRLGRTTLITDGAAGASDVRNNASADQVLAHAERALDLLRILQQQGLLEPVLELRRRATMADGCYELSVFFALMDYEAGAERLLRESMALEPENAMAMNNLGYMLLEQDRSGDEIAAMIERAAALLPGDPNILDTLGWLRYKQRRLLDEADAAALDPGAGGAAPRARLGALSLIRRAASASNDPSPEVLDHLGDASWRAGDKPAAQDAWTRAAAILEDPTQQQQRLREFAALQSQVWQLTVSDPRTIYQRQYGQVLQRVRAKLQAAQAGQEPQVAPTFDEPKPAAP